MRVQEFIEKYEKNNRIDIAKEIESKNYISILDKQQIAKLVLENCTSVVNGKIQIESIDRYILFTMTAIGAHTNLDFHYEDDDEGDVISDYDMLCSSGLLAKVIDTFKDDYMACQEILNMMTEDKLQESLTLEGIVYEFLENLQIKLEKAFTDLNEKIDVDALNKLKSSDLLKITQLLAGENKEA